MKRAIALMGVGLVGCAGPTERMTEQEQALSDVATTFHFAGTLATGDTCSHTAGYRASLCGSSFHGYLTVPTAGDGYHDGAGEPYGMVMHVNGMSPRVFHYVTVAVSNDVEDWFTPEPDLVDTFSVSASADYSNDGFYASFNHPTAMAIDDNSLMPDPARFANVCWDDSTGCPFVIRDAASSYRAATLSFSRASNAITIASADTESPYFAVTAAEWADADHTVATFSLEIYNAYSFASPTCEVWAQFGASSVQAIARHDGRDATHATLSIAAGDADPARALSAANITCSFTQPRSPIVQNTTIWQAN